MKTLRDRPSADKCKAALLIIDVQNGLFRKSSPIYQAESLLKNINTLVARADWAGAPVFLTHQPFAMRPGVNLG